MWGKEIERQSGLGERVVRGERERGRDREKDWEGGKRGRTEEGW